MDIDDTVGGVAIESAQLLASVLTDYPLPWSVTWDDFEMDITAANENRLIYGNVNRGVEYGDHSAIPEIIKRALSDFIKANASNERQL